MAETCKLGWGKDKSVQTKPTANPRRLVRLGNVHGNALKGKYNGQRRQGSPPVWSAFFLPTVLLGWGANRGRWDNGSRRRPTGGGRVRLESNDGVQPAPRRTFSSVGEMYEKKKIVVGGVAAVAIEVRMFVYTETNGANDPFSSCCKAEVWAFTSH